VPRGVLTERLESLRDADVLAETKGSNGYAVRPVFDEAGEDVVSKALGGAHRLLEPIRGRRLRRLLQALDDRSNLLLR
jgi:hypothetical protein